MQPTVETEYLSWYLSRSRNRDVNDFYNVCMTISLETGVAIADVMDYCDKRAVLLPVSALDVAEFWLRHIAEYGRTVDYRIDHPTI